MGIFNAHLEIRRRIDRECQRLGFDDQMRTDLTVIVCGRPTKLTLSMLKRLLIELQGMETDGEQLHPDSPLARYYRARLQIAKE
jgi:hypothetical protein